MRPVRHRVRYTFLSGEVAVQEVPGAELDEAAVGAGEPVAFGDGTVHGELTGAIVSDSCSLHKKPRSFNARTGAPLE